MRIASSQSRIAAPAILLAVCRPSNAGKYVTCDSVKHSCKTLPVYLVQDTALLAMMCQALFTDA